MPLRWKKGKIGRVWRLASDLRSKREGSLVVQTGFPTSLADLIVKNRDRLMKKKIVDSPLPLSRSSSDSRFSENTIDRSSCEESIGSETGDESLSLIAGGVEEVEVIAEDVRVDTCGSVRSFTVIVKLFALMILALGTKKLAIGITAGAFALLLFEFLGKCVFSCLKPCPDAQRSFGGVSLFVLEENGEVGLKQVAVVDGGLDLDESSRIPSQEILTIGSDLDPFDCERRCEFAGSDSKEVASVNESQFVEVKNGRIRKRVSSADFKAKLLKKFVPKKFRGSKGGKNGKECRIDSSGEVSGGGEAQQEEQQEQVEEEQQGKDDDEDDESCNLYDSSKVDLEEIDMTPANAGRAINHNLGPLVFLVIIPFGLVGGRVLAIVLVVALYLLVRLAETARRNLTMDRRGSLL